MKNDKIIVATTYQKDANFVINCLKKGENALFLKNLLIDFEIMPTNVSAAGLSRFFMDINVSFLVMILIHTENLYEDILFSQKILEMCKNSFIVIFDDTCALNKHCTAYLSDKLKTKVYLCKSKNFAKGLRKEIFKFITEEKESEYILTYPKIVSEALDDLKTALNEKNKFLPHLAPLILTSSKAELAKMSNEVGFDILDNLKILKALCVAMEFLNNCQIKKSEIELCINQTNQSFAKDLMHNLEKYKKD